MFKSKSRVTLYQYLLNEGFTPGEIQDAFEEEGGAREVTLSFFRESDGDDPVVGIAYNGDYRYEEEAGLRKLSERLASKDSQASYISKQDEVYVLSVGEDSYFDSKSESVQDARDRFEREKNGLPFAVWMGTRQKTVGAMRAQLKEAGVSPLPRKRADVERKFGEVILKASPREVNVGEFHYGKHLSIIPQNTLVRVALDYLVQVSAQANAVRAGSSSNPFSRGVLFYDDRDLTQETVLRRAAEKVWFAKQMKRADKAIKALKEAGHLYAIRPAHLVSVVHRPDLGEGDYFFVNYSRRGDEQIFGWFTVEELFQVADGSLTREMVEAKKN